MHNRSADGCNDVGIQQRSVEGDILAGCFAAYGDDGSVAHGSRGLGGRGGATTFVNLSYYMDVPEINCLHVLIRSECWHRRS
jgi:hypothetical protein